MEKLKKDFISYNFKFTDIQQANEEENPPVDRIIKTKQFFKDTTYGSFYSCIYKGKLRIHIVLSEDIADFNTEITNLIQETKVESKLLSGKMWISNHNHKLIDYLTKELKIERDSESFFYESYELIMPKEKFQYKFDPTLLDVRPYEKEHIDKYLTLLTTSMSFKIPPYNYVKEKDKLASYFNTLKENNAFEAFWVKDDLVGLYWIEGTEIDHLAVAEQYQHLGYGKQILTRAIEASFQNPEMDCAWLLVVGWNIKAFNFYKKYGLEIKNVHYVPYSEEM